MNPATLVFAATLALSFTVPVLSHAANAPAPSGGKDRAQQAQLSSSSDHDRHCQALQQRVKDLWAEAERAGDHGDFNHARDDIDSTNEQLTRDCGG